jgi:NitT/TauT family transport system substrate-binding protein
LLGWFTAFLGLCAAVAPALAQQQVKIGMGYGFAFLPLYICEDLKLIDKQAKAAHLDVQAKFQRFADNGELRSAIMSSLVDMGPFGTAPLLAAWQDGKDKSSQVLVVSGITSLPLALLSNRPDMRSIADLKNSDRIAVPTLTSPQMYLLEMQSEKTFGKFDHLRNQVVTLSHAQAIAALAEKNGKASAYFSSPPFTQIALRLTNAHVMLSSTDIMNGKSSFLILGARRSYVEAEPRVADIVGKAIEEAARLIRDDPKRAAQIYLTHEPSGTLNGATMESVVREVKDEFGRSVYGIQATADFMRRHGELKESLPSWKEIVAPPLLNSPST